MEEGYLSETITLISRDLSTSRDALEAKAGLSESTVLEKLASVVEWFLHNDFHRLLSILYRIDVPEENVHAALKPGGEQEPSRRLAVEILEREKQKVVTRQKYRGYNS